MSGSLAARHLVEGLSVRPANDSRRNKVHLRVIDTWKVWEERISQRRDLRDLAASPDLLMDIGISRYDALREGDKPFWRE